MRARWTQKEIKLLKAVWPRYCAGDVEMEEIAHGFHRTRKAIKCKADELGLSSERETMDEAYLRGLLKERRI